MRLRQLSFKLQAHAEFSQNNRQLLFVDRRAACDGAHDLDIFDFLLVHRMRIVSQRDEVLQLARCNRSFDRFLM